MFSTEMCDHFVKSVLQNAHTDHRFKILVCMMESTIFHLNARHYSLDHKN